MICIIFGLSIFFVFFMLGIIKGGHRVRGSGYERKLYFRSMVNTQKIEDSIRKEGKQPTRIRRNQYSLQTTSHQ